MANSKQAAAKRMTMNERAQQLMDVHFPSMPPAWVWRRKTNDGFTTLPRTLPVVMQAIDARTKGKPAGHTLFCLWARSPDHPFITIENPSTFAAEAGFIGSRAVDTWRRRMKLLRELWFIQTKAGPSGEFHYVLLINPNAAMEWMRTQGHMQDGLYGRFVDRLIEVGAFGEIEAVREVWRQQNLASAAKLAEPPPPPPPLDGPAPANSAATSTRKKAPKTKLPAASEVAVLLAEAKKTRGAK